MLDTRMRVWSSGLHHAVKTSMFMFAGARGRTNFADTPTT